MIADDGAMFTEEQGRAMIAAFDTFLAKWGHGLPPIHIPISQAPTMTRSTPDVSLEFFEKVMFESLTRFVASWRKEHAAEPGGWPMEMPIAEWDEQFLMWCDHPADDDDAPA